MLDGRLWHSMHADMELPTSHVTLASMALRRWQGTYASSSILLGRHRSIWSAILWALLSRSSRPARIGVSVGWLLAASVLAWLNPVEEIAAPIGEMLLFPLC